MQCPFYKPTRDKQMKIRMTEEECVMIDYAANLVNKSRTNFIIEQAINEAHNISPRPVHFRS